MLRKSGILTHKPSGFAECNRTALLIILSSRYFMKKLILGFLALIIASSVLVAQAAPAQFTPVKATKSSAKTEKQQKHAKKSAKKHAKKKTHHVNRTAKLKHTPHSSAVI